MSCPDCFRGGVSEATPTGTETTIHGIPTYVAHPDEGVTPKGIIVFITDAFGWGFVNNRVLSDRYAKKGGFIVYCPDFMNGNSLSPDAIGLMDKILESPSWYDTFMKPVYAFQALRMAIPWRKNTSMPITFPRVVSFIQALRTSPPPFATDNLKIGAAGFCWGGKHTFILARNDPASRVQRHESQIACQDPQPLIDCAFTAHPSMLEIPVDIDSVTVPTSVSCGDNDMALKLPALQRVQRILEEKNGGHEVVVIPGAKHGFAVRTHPDDEHEMACAEKAETQAIEWFTEKFAL